MEQRYNKETGLPVDRAYLECGLPPYLQRSLDTMKRAWEAEDNGPMRSLLRPSFSEIAKALLL